MAIASSEEACVALDSRAFCHVNVNKSFLPVAKEEITDSVPGYDHIFTDNKVGQFRKDLVEHDRVSFTPAHMEFLQLVYKRGALNPALRAPTKDTQKEMSQVRVHPSENHLFNRRKENKQHGAVLDIARIRQKFSQLKKEQGNVPLSPRYAFWNAHSIAELRARVGEEEAMDGDDKPKKKKALAHILARRDAESDVLVGLNDDCTIYRLTPPYVE